jgi:hypothetical protein
MRKQHVRGREVIMTPVDDAAYSRGLLEAFPELLFLEYGQSRDDGVRVLSSFAEPGVSQVWATLPPEGWGFDAELPESADWSWTFEQPMCVGYNRCTWDWTGHGEAKWAFDPPTLTAGNIWGAFFADDNADKQFVEKALRLLKKMSTNVMRTELPKLGIVYGEGRCERWAGFDALRWCGEKPTRMLDGVFRPTGDWSFPDDHPWYRGLEVDRGVSDRPPEPVLRGPGGVYIAPDDVIDRIRVAKRKDDA